MKPLVELASDGPLLWLDIPSTTFVVLTPYGPLCKKDPDTGRQMTCLFTDLRSAEAAASKQPTPYTCMRATRSQVNRLSSLRDDTFGFLLLQGPHIVHVYRTECSKRSERWMNRV